MREFLSRVVSTSDFPPQWSSGAWSDAHGWLHIMSDLAIALAFVAIPGMLGYFLVRRDDLPFRVMFWLFAVFILACSTTHLMEALAFWWPAYRLMGALKLVTAVVSWAAVAALLPLAPRIIAARSPKELEREVDERRRAHELSERRAEALREQAALLDLAHDAIFARNRTGLVTYWNQGAQETYGWTSRQALGQVVHELLQTRFPQPQPEIEAQVYLAGRWEGELVHVRSDGVSIVVESRWALQLDAAGRPCAILEINRDVSRRKEAEERAWQRTVDLEVANQALNTRALQQAAVALFGQRALSGVDLEVLLEEAASLASETLGVRHARVLEALGDGPRLHLRACVGWEAEPGLRTVLDVDEEPMAAHVLSVEQSALTVDWRNEARFDQPRFLRERWISCTLAVPIAGVDRPFGVLELNAMDGRTFSQDDQYFAQAVANVLASAVRRKVSEEEAVRHAAELQRSNRELEHFASVASHDLQEPLRKIQAFGDRLQTRYSDLLGEQGREYLERIQSVAARMRKLIDDLLSYSRVSTRAQNFFRVDLGREARQVVSDLDALVQRTGGRVELGALPTIEADVTQVRQLLQNLIANGLKFHRPDTPPVVRVEGRTGSAGANGPPDREGDAAVCTISVQDNGIGFEQQYVDRIFQVFQRLHGRQEYEGTGIGLAICRKIAERHGGSITATGVPGQGATFLVTLPVRQSDDEEPR